MKKFFRRLRCQSRRGHSWQPMANKVVQIEHAVIAMEVGGREAQYTSVTCDCGAIQEVLVRPPYMITRQFIKPEDSLLFLGVITPVN